MCEFPASNWIHLAVETGKLSTQKNSFTTRLLVIYWLRRWKFVFFSWHLLRLTAWMSPLRPRKKKMKRGERSEILFKKWGRNFLHSIRLDLESAISTPESPNGPQSSGFPLFSLRVCRFIAASARDVFPLTSPTRSHRSFIRARRWASLFAHLPFNYSRWLCLLPHL